jgi:hypothetical protein
VETLALILGGLPGTGVLRTNPYAYAALNAAHILGIALLLGAILPLDLRLMGILPGPDLAMLGPFLSRMAAAGLGLAVLTGILLISVRAGEYLSNPVLRTKLVLILVGTANALLAHAGKGWQGLGAGQQVTPLLRCQAGFSAAIWLLVLGMGRWIGFM